MPWPPCAHAPHVATTSRRRVGRSGASGAGVFAGFSIQALRPLSAAQRGEATRGTGRTHGRRPLAHRACFLNSIHLAVTGRRAAGGVCSQPQAQCTALAESSARESSLASVARAVALYPLTAAASDASFSGRGRLRDSSPSPPVASAAAPPPAAARAPPASAATWASRVAS
jgi:hypothetical protein